jgi:NtrC-family two-component system sensor histidine kinase KinB
MLRTRLMSGLLCLLIILLAMGLYSINQCSNLGKRIQKISRDNDEVGRNLGQMKRSGALMTGALLELVTGDEQKSRSDFNAASANFQKALEAEVNRPPTSSDEKKMTDQLSDAFKDYLPRANSFLRAPLQPNAGWRPAAAQLGKDTGQLLDLVNQIGLAHEKGLADGNKMSADDISGTIRTLLFFMIVAISAFLAAYFGLSQGLLNPIKSLTTSIQKVGEGNLDQTVPVLSKDELGVLAISFNQMAAQLRQYQANTSEELLRLNLTIRSTLASFPDPIFVLNSKGAVEFRNPAADQLAVKLLFSGVTRLPAQVDEKVEEVLASREDYLPTFFKDAIKFQIDGQDRYFLPRIVLLRDEKRETFGVAVILEDVTRMLLLDDVKSNLIATVSHELKTPLTSVRMALYLLYEKTVGDLNLKQTDLVEAARSDADRLLKTLNDLLDLAKLEQEPSLLRLAQVTPLELIDAAKQATRENANASHISLEIKVAEDLPKVRVDDHRIAYVFTNLINNAIKYSSSGGKVVVGAEMGETRASVPSIRFSVKDEGPGISAEHQEHIFERFYRVPGTNKTGAGLGLSIAREIVKAHHGEIGVISQPGQGSEFFFIIPLVFEDPVEPAH